MSKIKRKCTEWTIDAFGGEVLLRRGDVECYNYIYLDDKKGCSFLIYDEDLADFIDVLLEIQNG